MSSLNHPLWPILTNKYLPEIDKKSDEDLETQVHSVIGNLPIADNRLQQVKSETLKDPQLHKLMEMIREGWPESRTLCPSTLKECWMVREDLSVIDNIILKRDKLAISLSLRKEMLSKVHTCQMGIEKCKHKAQNLLYWPNNKKNHIQYMVARCDICQRHRKFEIPAKNEIPTSPWQNVATDLFTCNGADY